MPTRKLTDQAVRSLRADSGQVDYWDVSPKNFGVRISPSGRKTFVVRYRAAGRYRRMSLGGYPTVSLADARRRAKQVLGEAASNEDPAQVRQDARRSPSFEALAALYLEKYARRRKRSWRQDRRMINNELLPRWRTVRANEIRRGDVRNLVEAIAERPAPISANRVRALISKIFNFGISREMVEFNPCAQLEPPGRERRRDRVLTDTEIRAFWTVLDLESCEIAAAFRLRLVTAQRGVEVNNMRWTDIDLDGRWWTVPGSDAKNGLPHRVPLNDLAMAILTALRDGVASDVPASPYVLAGARSPRRRAAAIRRIELDDFRGHDLRRTAASRMASAGVPRLVIGKVLNHVERGVTAVYDRHTYDAEKSKALQTWCHDLSAILAQDPAPPSDARRSMDVVGPVVRPIYRGCQVARRSRPPVTDQVRWFPSEPAGTAGCHRLTNRGHRSPRVAVRAARRPAYTRGRSRSRRSRRLAAVRPRKPRRVPPGHATCHCTGSVTEDQPRSGGPGKCPAPSRTRWSRPVAACCGCRPTPPWSRSCPAQNVTSTCPGRCAKLDLFEVILLDDLGLRAVRVPTGSRCCSRCRPTAASAAR